MANQFKCNDVLVLSDSFIVRRGPFGTDNSKCGMTKVKYKKRIWTCAATNDRCPFTNKRIYIMTRKSTLRDLPPSEQPKPEDIIA